MKHIMAILIGVLLVSSVAALTLGPMSWEAWTTAQEDPVFYNELGFMLAEEGKSAEAQEAFARAVSLDPSYATARKNLAVSAFGNGDYATAIEQYRTLLADSSSAELHFDLGQSLVHQARYIDADVAKLEEAITHFQAAELLQPGFPHARENAAIVQRVLDDL